MVGKSIARGFLSNKSRISNTTALQGEENMKLGEMVFIGHFNFIDATYGLTIEKGTQITNYVSILTHSSHNAVRLYGAEYMSIRDKKAYNIGEVSIGEYAYIGPHTVIMPNTKIGKGSLVGAYSYVKGTFPDFAIITGNPGKIVGDTRKMDERLLRQYPELKPLYDEWAQG
mgnify:CR=1 FL=1